MARSLAAAAISMADVKADVGRIVLRNINGKQGMSLQNSGRNNQAQQTSLMVWNSPIPSKKEVNPVNPSNEFLPPFEAPRCLEDEAASRGSCAAWQLKRTAFQLTARKSGSPEVSLKNWWRLNQPN